MSGAIEYFFDYSCPYAYLGSTQIQGIAARAGVELNWRPMLLGGVFRELGTPQNLFAEQHASKIRHNAADLNRWAGIWDVPLRMPSGHPIRTVSALRATLAAPSARRADLIHRLYRAYWVDGIAVSQTAALEHILDELGLDRSLAGPHSSEWKDALRANTDEALARGVFGAPAVFCDGQMYYGQDRLWMLERALGLESGQGELAHVPDGGALPGEGVAAAKAEFWYDFSSPFTYLAATQVPAMQLRTGRALEWKPFLLGALFRSLGGPDVPLSTFPPSKTKWVATDMQRWADYWNVPYKWPTRFPMRTILPLRVALAIDDESASRAFVLRTFAAYWAEDRDISSEDTVRGLLQDVGQDPAVIERTQAPEIKQALIDNTNGAAAAGLFGAPTFTVGDQMVWGQDRLGFVERYLRQ